MDFETDSVSSVNCRACGRVLKKQLSLERGMGPVCFKKSQHLAVLEAIREDTPIVMPAAAF